MSTSDRGERFQPQREVKDKCRKPMRARGKTLTQRVESPEGGVRPIEKGKKERRP